MQFPQFEAHASLEDRHWWFTARRQILQSLLRRLVPADPRRRIVDVGCGTGGNTAFLAREYGCIGIDPDSDAIGFAQAKYPDVRFVRGFAPADIRAEMRSADAVLLMDVLEHIEHDRPFLHDLIASMKPGAFLIMMAPADPALWSPHDRGFGHYRRYTLGTFRALWKGEPVEERIVSHCNSRLYSLVQWARVLTRLRGKPLGHGDSDLSLPFGPINALLHRIFAGEGKRFLAMLADKNVRGYRRGVSVFGVLRRI